MVRALRLQVGIRLPGGVLRRPGGPRLRGGDRTFQRPGDVLVGITTSGNSTNVAKACETSRSIGMVTVGMTGGDGGKIAKLVDHHLCITCTTHVPRVQEGHQLLMHLICERVEEIMTGAR